MEIRTHLASESLTPEDQMITLGSMTYEQPAIIQPQETKRLNCWQRRASRKTRPAQVTEPVTQQNPVQQNIQVQNDVQPVPIPEVQPQVQVRLDSDPVVPNLGPSMFRRSQKRMTFSSNHTTSTEPESPNLGVQAESQEDAKLRRLMSDSLWCGALTMYYSQQNVRFKLSSLQLQELGKLDTEISNIRDNTGRFDCKILMKKFLLLEGYDIPDIGPVYEDGVISKNFPMDLLKMILIRKGHNIDNLSKTQMIRELSNYDRTLLAFTMVPSVFWGPRI